jgi:tubulin monoglycylase TTLL3/8
LTNATINKGNIKTKSKGKYKIKNNMWETSNFSEFLANEYSEVCEDPLTDVVFPQIKQGIIDSILAVKEVLHHRDLSHEMFGYDFMVDAELNVWLIEVNSSPSMAHSTPITEKLVP